MGAPSDHDPDRQAAQPSEAPVDEAWAAGSPAHNDRTTASLDVDRTTPDLVPLPTDHDQTVVAPYARHGVPHAPGPGLSLLEPGKGVVPLDKERVLVQPESSPLDFVMRHVETAAPASAHASGDSSRFVAALIGDQSPPRVEPEVVTTLQPVLRRARRGRTWIIAGTLAATTAFGAALAIKVTGADTTPKTAANESAKVIERSVPAAEPGPTPSTAPTSTDSTDVRPVAEPPEPSNDEPVPPDTQPGAELAAVAAKDTSATKSSTTKTPARKKPTATHAAAKKSTTAKKPTSAKKSSASKVSTAKKPSASKHTSTANKASTKKAPSTAKKKPTAKKTSAKKSSSSQRGARDARRTSSG